MMLSTLLSASVYIVIRKIGRDVSPTVLVFYWGLFGVILFPVFYFVLDSPLFIPDTWHLWGLFAVLAMLSIVAQWVFNKGVQLEKAAIASVVQNSSIFFSFLFQLIFLGIPPGFIYSCVGGFMIVSVIIAFAIRSLYFTPPPPPPPPPSSSSSSD